MRTITSQAFAYVPPSPMEGRSAEIVATTKMLHVFKQDMAPGHGVLSLTDDKPVTHMIVCARTRRILTFTDTAAKVWLASTGKLLQEHRDIVSTAITAVCVDSAQVHFFVGEHDGRIKCFTVNRGVKVKELMVHSSEISKLIYCPETSTIISADWSGSIIIHDDTVKEGGSEAVLRCMNPNHILGHTNDITTAAYSRGLSLVATGSADSSVRLWDFVDGKLDGMFKHESGHTTCIQFLTPFPLVMVGVSNGDVEVWGCRYSVSRYQRLIKFVQKSSKRVPAAVITAVWHKQKQLLVTGNEYGDIHAYSFVDFLQASGDAPIDAGVTREQPEKATPVKRQSSRMRRRSTSKQQVASKATLRMPERVWHIERGHMASVSAIDILQGTVPCVVLTSSVDCQVKMWDVDNGDILGSLRQGQPDEEWKKNLTFLKAEGVDAAVAIDTAVAAASATDLVTTRVPDDRKPYDWKRGPEVSDLKTKLPAIVRSIPRPEDSKEGSRTRNRHVARNVTLLHPKLLRGRTVSRAARAAARKFTKAQFTMNTGEFVNRTSGYLQPLDRSDHISEERRLKRTFYEKSAIAKVVRHMVHKQRTLYGRKIMRIKDVFVLADRDNSGSLDREEFLLAMSRLGLGLTEAQITGLMDDIDDGDGLLDYSELFQFFSGDFDVPAESSGAEKNAHMLENIKQAYWSGMLEKNPARIEEAVAVAQKMKMDSQVSVGMKLLQQLNDSI